MKITVSRATLSEKLQAQRERALNKKQEAEVFQAAHVKTHKADDSDRICPFDMTLRVILANIDNHVRRVSAVIEVLDSAGAPVEMELREYLDTYVDGPFDNVLFPPPETADDSSFGRINAPLAAIKLN